MAWILFLSGYIMAQSEVDATLLSQGETMKILSVLATMIAVLFLAAPSNIQAQKRGATAPSAESIANTYFRNRVTSESGGALVPKGFRKTNGYEQGYGLYVIEWQAEILFQQDCWKPGNMFEGYWQNFGVVQRQPGTDFSAAFVGGPLLYKQGTTIRLTGNATLRKTERGWRIEGFDVKTYQQPAVQKPVVKPLPVIKRGVQPIVDAEIAVIEMENSATYGTIKIELYSNLAPKMVARFKQLAKEGVFDGMTWHRVNSNVIQSGDPLSKDADPTNDGAGSSSKPNVEAEFSDIIFDLGTVGAARSADPDSANSQFFIMLKRQPSLDTMYTVFGRVFEGIEYVRAISSVQPKEGERPVTSIRIRRVSIVPRGNASR